MTKTGFKTACALLWGPQYISEAARQLGLGRRTATRYDVGDSPVPDVIADRLVKLLKERQREIERALAKEAK